MDSIFRPTVSSVIPEGCKASACVLGIDEGVWAVSRPPLMLDSTASVFTPFAAGRGPFLGPMIYACAFWPAADDARISRMGFDDSKAITNEKRRSLFSSLQRCGEVGYVIVSISSEDISARMLRRTPVSLNAISHDTAEQLVRTVLDAGVALSHVYVDTVGDAGVYQAKLTKLFGNRIPFTVTPKADSLFKCVSAASICAKVTRDDALEHWRFREPHFAATCAPPGGEKGAVEADSSGATPAKPEPPEFGDGADDVDNDDDVDELLGADAALPTAALAAPGGSRAPTHPGTAGSGYPGDPLTKAWAAANFDPLFGWPSVVRFSWSTAKVAFKAPGAVRVTWEGDDEDGNPGEGAAAAVDAKQQRLSAFFSSAPSGGRGGEAAPPPAAGRFFAKRGIEAVLGHSDRL